jgi:hypothetical protein
MRILLPALFLAALAVAVATAGETPTPPPVRAGQKAPPWRLNDQDGVARSLAEARDGAWVVMAFFPKALTPG